MSLEICDVCPYNLEAKIKYPDNDFCMYCGCNSVCMEGFINVIDQEYYEYCWIGYDWWGCNLYET